MVAAIISLAHALNLQVVAEGVEKAEELDKVDSMEACMKK